MLDLQRHTYCPIWTAVPSAELHDVGLQYACQKVLETYCKVFDRHELFDLIVR